MSYQSEHTGAVIDSMILALSAGRGIANISNGVVGGSVTGLALPFTPSQVLVTVMIPDEGSLIYAIVVTSSITTDGFDYYLSGETDSADYKLSYLILP